MIFRSPSSDTTKPLETDGSFVIFWRKWFFAVAQWLLEASRTSKATATPSADVPWVQHGQIVFVDYAGADAITVPVGFAKGSVPPPAYDTFLIRYSKASSGGKVIEQKFLASATELNLIGPTKGWFIAKEAANGST